MKRKWHVTIQAFLFFLHSLNVSHIFGEYELLIGTFISALQGALAIYVHGINPDGTPAEAAYKHDPKYLRSKKRDIQW